MNSIDIVNWVNIIFTMLAAFITLATWFTLIYSGIRRNNYKWTFRSFTVLNMFFAWIIIIIIQNWLSNHFSNDLFNITYKIGFVLLPLTLIALWRVVFLATGDQLRSVLKRKYYRNIFILVIFIYTILYTFASGMVTVNRSEDLVPLERYIEITQTYGPLSPWPSIEFWFPTVNLFGTVSLAAVLMMATITSMFSITIVLMVNYWELRKKLSMKTATSTVGSGVFATLTSFACCTFPVVYPILILIFGSATAEPLLRLITNETGLFINVMQMAVLSLMVMCLIYIGDRINLEVANQRIPPEKVNNVDL
ncbi:hypothetical protein [Salipaludibacillus sp. CF4.18]|uniref:hypothetical protein n=1 Tax=Salipaludibacillus sp. CF4.18 TaxID=3373081 RepID=UPI003EE6D712